MNGSIKKVSLKDLSKICDCSITSVSRALKNSDTISKELREKVQSIANELGYVPNLLAGSLRTGYTNSIAVILPDLRNPFFSLLADHLEDYARSKGYSLFFMSTNDISEHEHNAVIEAMRRNVDGILIVPNQEDTQSIELLKKNNFPYVITGRVYKDIKADYIFVNDKKGAYLATSHLIERGHKRILFINSYMHISSSVVRLDGYKAALKDHGVPFCENDVVIASTKIGDAEKIIRQVFSKTHDYTAIFCYCDVIALETIFALNTLGLNVPKDIAVAGVDDLHADIRLPIQLTSASHNRKELAQNSIDLLIDNINNPIPFSEKTEFVIKMIDVKLTIGQTT